MVVERIVLIGFMASGKTEVGRRLAGRLGWRHVDLDHEIEARTGRTIAELFETDGEGAFRAHEVRLTPEITRLRQVVISTGGGWVTNPGLLSGLPPGSFTVYLRVSPAEVRRRLEADPGQATRPLLQGTDPDRRINELMATREPLYRQAEFHVETDRLSPAEIADEVYRAVQDRIRSADESPAASPSRSINDHAVSEPRDPGAENGA